MRQQERNSQRIYNASHWYINSHERSILEAQQSYIDTLDRIQEDLSKERWEKGYELVMVSSASALSLVLSSGLLTTGTLTAETAALSTVAVAFVYSDYIEGVQEMYYGCVGDISSASVNPLKDTVFGGWEEGYQAAEMLSIGVASYSGMQDIARAEQAAQLEQIYAQEAEQNAIEQTVKFNFDEVDYQKWLERAELGNTGHPGMSREDYIRFQYSDTRVAEQIAYNEVDIDELLKLRQNNGQYAERIGIGGESSSGSIIYGELDSLGRTTGIEATIMPDMIGTGSPAKSSIKPVGFGGQAQGHSRGHLLGKQLGGSGSDPRNLVTIYQNPVNHPVMSSIEVRVRRAVEGGQIVNYKVTPIYEGNNLIPRGITIQAQGSGDLNIYQTILNRK